MSENTDLTYYQKKKKKKMWCEVKQKIVIKKIKID